ncbi:MAG: C25 family cysteine peptidase [Bacteroides sp.]|nr:C25 family cysteine peptidase [Bacteroides sp.]MCM1390463.1 C25 family cysteine peptidase [Bacteroides sp.]
MKYFVAVLCLLFLPRLLKAEEAGVRMLIIADSRFLTCAERLADIHRSRQGMNVKVLEADYDTPAEDLRLKVKRIYDSSGGALEYLMLYGTGWTDGGCDAYHGMVKGVFSLSRLPFTAPALAVGRIPVSSIVQGEEYNDKILRYLDSADAVAHSHEIVLAADDGDNMSHQNDAEEAAGCLLSYPGAVLHKIYVSEYSKINGTSPGCSRSLIERLETGAGLWVYVGHGDEVSITGDGLMDSYGAGILQNDVLPWGFFSSCCIGKFGGTTESFTESLLFNRDGGVIGCVASPQEVYASYNRQVLMAFARRWADAAGESKTFGDIWLASQKECLHAAASQANKVLGQNTLSFNLLGDPALPLKRTRGIIECEYQQSEGSIAGVIDAPVGDLEVEAMIYTSSMRGNGVNHDDIQAGWSAVKVEDGAFEIPVRLPASFSGRQCRAVLSAVSRSSGDVWTGDVSFVYSHKVSGDAAHEPVILGVEVASGIISVDVVTDGSMPCQSLGEIGAYSRCVIDGRVVVPLSVADASGDCCRLVSPCPVLPSGKHDAEAVVVDNNGAVSRRCFSFVNGAEKLLKLSAYHVVARERVEFHWDMPLPGIPLLLKITDVDGDLVHSAQVADVAEYGWNLLRDDGVKASPGIYYCHIVSSVPGLAYSRRLRFSVLP